MRIAYSLSLERIRRGNRDIRVIEALLNSNTSSSLRSFRY